MRLLKESVLRIWKARKEAVRSDLADAERRTKAIQLKLDRLDEAFLFDRSIDVDVSDRHAEKLRQELTLVRIDRHASEVEELDVEGILAFAERILPRAPISGRRRHSTSASGSNSCSFRRESRSTAPRLLEPPQLHRPSTAYSRRRLRMKVWWT